MYIICCVLWKGYNAEKASYPPVYVHKTFVNATATLLQPEHHCNAKQQFHKCDYNYRNILQQS